MIRILAFVVFVLALASTASAQQNGAPISMIPVITGQVLSVDSRNSEFPLWHAISGDERGWVEFITLSRLNPESGIYDYWVNSSDCWVNHQGCADRMGNYRFSQDFFGNNLTCGDYEIVVQAWGHEISRKYVTVCDGLTTVTHRVQMKQVSVDTVAFSEVLPSDGGMLWLSAQVCNLDSPATEVQAQVLKSGPSKTQWWGAYQVPYGPVPVPAERWKCEYVEFSTHVDGSLPNGYHCANFTVGTANEPMGEAGACVRKVALPLAIPVIVPKS